MLYTWKNRQHLNYILHYKGEAQNYITSFNIIFFLG